MRDVSFVEGLLEAGLDFMDGMELTPSFDGIVPFGHALLVLGVANFVDL